MKVLCIDLSEAPEFPIENSRCQHLNLVHDVTVWNDFSSQVSPDFSLENYESLVIAVHGILTDTAHCFYNKGAFNYDIYCDYLNLATKVYSLFQAHPPSAEYKLNLTLIMCYGARADQYTINHLENRINYLDESFAGKFSKELRRLMNSAWPLAIISYTGAVKIDKTGKVMCQTESQVLRPASIVVLENSIKNSLQDVNLAILEAINLENESLFNRLVSFEEELVGLSIELDGFMTGKLEEYGLVAYNFSPGQEDFTIIAPSKEHEEIFSQNIIADLERRYEEILQHQSRSFSCNIQ